MSRDLHFEFYALRAIRQHRTHHGKAAFVSIGNTGIASLPGRTPRSIAHHIDNTAHHKLQFVLIHTSLTHPDRLNLAGGHEAERFRVFITDTSLLVVSTHREITLDEEDIFPQCSENGSLLRLLIRPSGDIIPLRSQRTHDSEYLSHHGAERVVRIAVPCLLTEIKQHVVHARISRSRCRIILIVRVHTVNIIVMCHTSVVINSHRGIDIIRVHLETAYTRMRLLRTIRKRYLNIAVKLREDKVRVLTAVIRTAEEMNLQVVISLQRFRVHVKRQTGLEVIDHTFPQHLVQLVWE